ncbi:MAG: hypothetical protein IT324_08100 [Anaerolineae bacterium]|nr:hypothetical protein [Anaerolineae bacterium]
MADPRRSRSCPTIPSSPSSKPIAFPKGVPPLPTTPTVYVAFVGGKPWRKVKDALNDPDGQLVIEGNAAYHPELKGMVFHPTYITSIKLQRAAREQQAGPKSEEPST